MNKYHAIKTTIDGIIFDSKREAERYAELRLLERAGEISALKIHPKYILAEAVITEKETIRPIYYIGDFEYREGDRIICEDIKGGRATQTAVFKLKVKLFKARYPEYELRIVN